MPQFCASDTRQAGRTGMVTAPHDVLNEEACPLDEMPRLLFLKRQSPGRRCGDVWRGKITGSCYAYTQSGHRHTTSSVPPDADDKRKKNNPGYSAIGRLKELAKLRGLEWGKQRNFKGKTK